MTGRIENAVHLLRDHGVAVGAALALLAGAVGAARFIASSRSAPPPPRKVMQFTTVNLQPVSAVKPPPPPKDEEDPVQPTRVNLKPSDFTQPDLSRPSPSPAAGGGQLSLATEESGPGDAFNLAGNPGGRALLSGGGLGDGTGDLLGDGRGSGNRFGWYYARLAGEIESAFRKNKALAFASLRVELRVWADPDGRISRVQLVSSTGDAAVDRAIQSVVGLRMSEPPPAEIPMPMIARLTARRVVQ